MSNFGKIDDYKSNILSSIISNENLVKAIANNEDNFLDHPVHESPHELIYKNIFPYSHVPSIESEAKTYITMDFDNFRYSNREFKNGVVTLYLFSHESLVTTAYGTLRYDFMRKEIDNMFNQKRGIVGDFQMNLEASGDFKATDKHFGAYIGYRFVDFQ